MTLLIILTPQFYTFKKVASSFGVTWMDVEIIILSDVSQTKTRVL